VLLCARDARFFDLVLLWARTRLPALFANLRVWKASSYCPLALDLPSRRGCRRAVVSDVSVSISRAGA
jgi:type IV secretion system protein VirB3